MGQKNYRIACRATRRKGARGGPPCNHSETEFLNARIQKGGQTLQTKKKTQTLIRRQKTPEGSFQVPHTYTIGEIPSKGGGQKSLFTEAVGIGCWRMKKRLNWVTILQQKKRGKGRHTGI